MGIIGTAVKIAGAYFVINTGLKTYAKHSREQSQQEQEQPQPQGSHSPSPYPSSSSPHFDSYGKAIAHQHASYCNGQCQGQCTTTTHTRSIGSTSQQNPHHHQQEQWPADQPHTHTHDYAVGAPDQKPRQLSQVAENLDNEGYRTPPAYERSGMVIGNGDVKDSAIAL